MSTFDTPFVSFCIPVYNRQEYIFDTLVSLLEQPCSLPFEVIVSDNCSTDNTFDIVDQLRSEYSNLKLFRLNSNMGADANYLNVVNHSTSKYCWLFGSDDLLLPGSLQRVVDHLLHYSPNICLLDQYIGSKHGNILSSKKILANVDTPTTYSLCNKSDLREYLSLATSQSSIFGFLSIIIFDRQSWNSISVDPKYLGSLYVHAQKLFSIALLKSSCLLYIPYSAVIWRGGNDSFGGPGKFFYRYNIDFDGFKLLHDDFIPPDLSLAFRALFRRHHPFLHICYLRLNCTHSEFISIKHKLLWYGYSPTLLSVIQSDLVGHLVLAVLSRLFKYLSSIIRFSARSLQIFN